MITSGSPMADLRWTRTSMRSCKHRRPPTTQSQLQLDLCSGTVKIMVIQGHSVPDTANRVVLTMNLYW